MDQSPAASRPDTIVAILAGGGGSRFRGPTHKLSARLPATDERPGEAVIARSVAIARLAGVGPIVVVGGALDAETIRSHLDHDTHGAVEVLDNPAWAEGQATSVRCAVVAAQRAGATRVVIGLGDQPGITTDTWRTVASTEGSIVVATYDGRRGNPVALQSDVWDLLPVEGDEGARSLMRLRPDLVVAVPCSGSPDDIDTTEDLRRWQNNSSTNSP